MTNAPHTPTAGVRRRLVPPLAALAVLAVLVGGGYAVRSSSDNGSGGGTPPVLRLADYREPAANAAPDDQFRLAADLPAGPSDAAVRWLTAPDKKDVERLAKALGLRGQLVRRAGASTYTTDSAGLRVQQGAGGQWQYVGAAFTAGSVACPPQPTPVPKLDDPDLSVACDVDVPGPGRRAGDSLTGGGAAVATPRPMTTPSIARPEKLSLTTEAGARAAARPVLEAVGIAPEAATVLAAQPFGLVAAEPVVAGLPTHGLTTSVTVSGRRVNAASGWLGGSREAATYPVISARAAWQQLRHQPMARPLIGCPDPGPKGSDPMVCGGPVTVTGARFGLSLHEVNGRPLLVPSWLFHVRNSASELSVVAVDPRYLAAAPAPTAGTEKPGSSGSGSGGSTGSTDPAGPPDAPSTSASPGQPSADSRFSHVTASGSGLVVTFTGGVADCFSYTVVHTETGKQVSLSLVEKTTSGNKPCVDMAQVYDRRVALAEPLGTRRVVDATSGAVLLGPSK